MVGRQESDPLGSLQYDAEGLLRAFESAGQDPATVQGYLAHKNPPATEDLRRVLGICLL